MNASIRFVRLKNATTGLLALTAVAALPLATAHANPEEPAEEVARDVGNEARADEARDDRTHANEGGAQVDPRERERERREERREEERQRRDGLHSVIGADGMSRRNVEDAPGDFVPTAPPTRERGDLSGQIGRLSGTMEIDNGVHSVATCKDGATRTPNPAQTTPVSWVLPEPIPPKVEIASQSEHGRYRVDGAENAFEPLTGLSQLPPLPGPAGVVARGGKVVGVGAEVGDAGAKAAHRWAQANAAKMVDLRVSIFKMQVDVQCTAVEVCKKGAWVPAGMAPVKEERKPLMPPIRYRKNGIGGKEVPRYVSKALSRARPLQIALAQYEADPCTGAATPGGTGAGGGGVQVATGGAAGGKNCTPLKVEHTKVLEQLRDVTNRHAEAHLPILDLEVELAKVDLDWANARKAAQKTLDDAEAEQKNAVAYHAGLLQNTPVPGALERAETRIRKADRAVSSARTALAKVDSEFQAKKAAVEARLADARKELERLAKEKARLEKLEAEALGRYLDCLAGK